MLKKGWHLLIKFYPQNKAGRYNYRKYTGHLSKTKTLGFIKDVYSAREFHVINLEYEV